MRGVPSPELQSRPDALQIVGDPIERARAGVAEHDVVEEHGVEQAVPHPEDEGGAVRARRHRHDELDGVVEIASGGGGQRAWVGAERIPIRRRQLTTEIVAGAISRGRHRPQATDGDRPARRIGDDEFVRPAPVVDLEKLQLVQVVRLVRLVPHFQPHCPPPVRVRPETEAVHVSRLE